MNAEKNEAIRILLLEDTATDMEIAKREIARDVAGCEFHCVETRDAFLAGLATFRPDLIVSDFNLHNFDGLSALKLAQEHTPLTPLIILTGSINEDTAVNCLKAGASNYVIKEHIKRLGQSVRHALAEGRLRRERHAAQEALEKNERYFRSLIENAQDLITVLDAQSRVTFQSPSIERILGYPLSEFLKLKVLDLIHPEDRARAAAALQRILIVGACNDSLAVRIRHADGSWRHLECNGKLLQDGGPTVVVNSRDVTTRRQLEEQLRQAQKMEAIGHLASGVAHDFNNILTSIMGNAALLRHDESLPASQVSNINEIIMATEQASGLTRQLLLFSRKHPLQLAKVDLNEVVLQMFKMLQRILGKQTSIALEREPDLPPIRGDVGMLDQVLLNLAVNARDAMPNGGQIRIRTWLRQPVAAAPASWVCLSVSDAGCGIPPEHLSHIFEPFFTTKEPGKGTGLGLSTVYGIVKQHEGTIEVASEPNLGTTFDIMFPALTGESAAAPVVKAVPQLATGGELILLVEDELAVRLVVSRLLQRCGYQVLPAQSGPEALAIWAENKDHIKLVLTDIMMPDGMTGHELVAQLRAEAPGLRVVYSSGYSPEMAVRSLEQEPRTRFIQKPYSFADLSKTVRACLDENTAPVRAATAVT